MNKRDIHYIFQFSPGYQKTYRLQFNEQTSELMQAQDEHIPKWTALDFHQCPHCPLDSESHKKCPVAASLVPFVDLCGDLESFQTVDVEVQTMERTYSIKKTTTQRAFSSLLGLIIATSSCPHTLFFRPMARFHVPLANEQETLFRVSSSYLLLQYFKKKNDQDVDFELQGLNEIYKNIERVNFAMADRLREAGKKDAAVNSIILLDLMAKTIPYSISEALQELEYLYKNLIHYAK